MAATISTIRPRLNPRARPWEITKSRCPIAKTFAQARTLWSNRSKRVQFAAPVTRRSLIPTCTATQWWVDAQKSAAETIHKIVGVALQT